MGDSHKARHFRVTRRHRGGLRNSLDAGANPPLFGGHACDRNYHLRNAISFTQYLCAITPALH